MVDISDQNVISFIVPVLNREKYIGQCLEHILREAGEQDEVIVVDNGSTDGTLRIVGQYPRVKILQEPEVTIAALRNRGARVAMGDLFAFIDSDCLVCPGWRNAVTAALDDPRIHAVGSRYNIPGQATWVEHAWYSMRMDHVAPVTYINAGNLIVKREVFETISGFDENLVTDEDYEFGVRLNRLGYCIMEVPGIRVIHLGNAKTLAEFFRKEKWHSTSGLKFTVGGCLDRPMVMTIMFIVGCLTAVVLLAFAFAGDVNFFFVPVAILIVPAATAGYRVYQYGNYRFFFHLVVLYCAFFCAREVTAFKFLLGRHSRA